MERTMGEVLLITAVAGMGGTGLGGLAACLFRRDSSKVVSLLLSFAAGMMTAVVCCDLLADAAAPGNLLGAAGLPLAAGGILGGYGAIWILNVRIDKGLREEKGQSGQEKNLLLAGAVMAVAIALHNVPEGMVIGASFAKDAGGAGDSGILMALVIGLHNVPEGMAVAVPLITGRMRAGRAVLITAAAGLPTLLGAMIGLFLGSIGPVMLTISLGAASGAMLYVVFVELLPESLELWRSRTPALAVILGVITGMVIVYY